MNRSAVYLRTNEPLEVLAKRVQAATGLALERVEGDPADFFGAIVENGEVGVELALNESDWDERAAYAYELDVDARDDEKRIAFARRLFDALRRSADVPLLLWDEQRDAVDRYEPSAPTSS